MEEFGLKIVTPEDRKEIQKRLKRITLPEQDGSLNVQTGGGYYGYYMDMDGSHIQNDTELIEKYRNMAGSPDIDQAVEIIINESIIFDTFGNCVDINLEEIKTLNDNSKKRIQKEFKNILSLLNFNLKGYDIFRNWYVDGRLYYHLVIDPDKIKDGIQELDYIDPRKIKKIREIDKKIDNKTGVEIVTKKEEFFVYNNQGVASNNLKTYGGGLSGSGIKIANDAIVYVPSGLLNVEKNQVISYLHKAIKPYNQLKMVEDALVIYRLARAPERRLFYIDVGTMSSARANQYVKSLQQSFRNKLVYDAQTGDIRDDRKFMSMLEDFWLPRREGGKGTEISTLPGGENLGQIDDVNYFKDKLYRSLNIPVSRLQTENGFSLGRSTEITRDEIAFAKFINKIRKKFSQLFNDLLEKQLVLKGLVTTDEWQQYKNLLYYDFQKDNNFDELKEAELLRDRVDILNLIDPFVGKYFSKEWAQRNVLRLDDDEIKEIEGQIESEPKPKETLADLYGNVPDDEQIAGMQSEPAGKGSGGEPEKTKVKPEPNKEKENE